MATVEEFSKAVNDVKDVLDDPHPGLITWRILWETRMEALCLLYLGEAACKAAFEVHRNKGK